MLEIKPIQTKMEQKEICELCDVEFKIDTMAYSAKENGELLGVSQFRIKSGYGEIYDLKNKTGVNDLEALIIMGRATLNFIDLCGVKKAKISTEEKNLPKILEFEKNEKDEWFLDLEGYFNSPCQRHKSENKSTKL